VPTILLSLHFSLSSTLFRTFQSLCIMISSCSHLALTRLTGITSVGLITCFAIPFPVALIVSITNIFTLYPSFDLKTFERQQLYEIWPYMRLLIICPCLYIPIVSSPNLSCSKVFLNIAVRLYGSFRPPFWSMKSTNSSQCLTSVYKAWSCLGARTISFPFNTHSIITVDIVFGNSGRLLPPYCPCTLANWLPVACCLAFPSSSPLEFCLHIASKTSPTTTGESIWHYGNYPTTASSRMSPNNLRLPSPSAGVHLELCSICSALRLWTDASSRESSPPILSYSCWMHCSWPTPSFFQIASRRTLFASG